MRNSSVKLTPLGEWVFAVGVGLSLAVVGFGLVKLMALLVVSAAQFLGLN